jgi:hypothetical protein
MKRSIHCHRGQIRRAAEHRRYRAAEGLVSHAASWVRGELTGVRIFRKIRNMATKRRSPDRPNRTRMISATDAAKSFGKLIEHVRSERAEYIVERSGTAAVRIVPASASRCTGADLVRLVKTLVKADEAYLAAVESGISTLNKASVPNNRWDS